MIEVRKSNLFFTKNIFRLEGYGYVGYGSSHTALIAEHDHLREEWIGILNQVHCYRGLRLMPDRPRSKNQQFYCLRADIVQCQNSNRILFLGLSNDWESLLVQRGNTLRLKKQCMESVGSLVWGPERRLQFPQTFVIAS